MGNRLTLYRGFVVEHLKDVAKPGLNIPNPRWHHLGEINWPGGISFGRLDAFSLALEISQQSATRMVPVCGRIEITEEGLRRLGLTGIKRIMDWSEGMSPGSINYWPCLNWEDVSRAWEFTIDPKDLHPKGILRLNGAISTEPGIFVSFDQFKRQIEGGSFIERLLPR